jgi:hypothetical protein
MRRSTFLGPADLSARPTTLADTNTFMRRRMTAMTQPESG